ncbi:zinc finger CCCH-type with G patch domain-containing protein-like [Lineus longissimus]|uniref:zinc finger CCCH-type with G patch domain-containing protein-like n=1 Tax=Lineus longissimus TaxID=88925 RepID=UPI002B4F982C
MADEEETSLELYKTQLEQVEAALQTSGCTDCNLLQLKSDLIELVKLTEESVLKARKEQLLAAIETEHPASASSSFEPDFDAEMAAFKAELGEDLSQDNFQTDGNATTKYSNIADNDGDDDDDDDDDDEDDDDGESSNNATLKEIQQKLQGLEGTKCRVPFTQDWGSLEYHNALVLSAEPIDMETGELKVRVVFCNPTHRSMLPCPYFLDGNCKFPQEECRYSHGHVVSVSDIQTFDDPDHSNLSVDQACLAKYRDGIWYRATIQEVHAEDHQCTVAFDSYKETAVMDVHDILPKDDIERGGSSDEEDDQMSRTLDLSSSEDEDALPVFLWRPPKTTAVLGEWEQHTKGIASKLMAKMGYVMGQGLGKDGKGRADPVPIQLLPPGKSLDKIMELKEKAGDLSLFDALKKDKIAKKKLEKKLAKAYEKAETNPDVFDFINKKLRGKKGNVHDLKPPHQKKLQPTRQISEKDLNKKSEKGLNVQLFKTQEEIKKVEAEIGRVRQGMVRNAGSSKFSNHATQKLDSLGKYLNQLKSSENSIQQHQAKRDNHKKLTVF